MRRRYWGGVGRRVTLKRQHLPEFKRRPTHPAEFLDEPLDVGFVEHE